MLGTLEHLLISCPLHDPTRISLRQMLIDRSAELPELHAFVQQVLASPPPIQLQFILEPQAFPQIRNLFNCLGQPAIELTCYLVRTYAFYIHRQRQICLGRWPGHTTPTIVIPSNNLVFSPLPNHDQEEDARSALSTSLNFPEEQDVSPPVHVSVQRTPGPTMLDTVVPALSTSEEPTRTIFPATQSSGPGWSLSQSRPRVVHQGWEWSS